MRNIKFADPDQNAPDPLAEPSEEQKAEQKATGGYSRLWLQKELKADRELFLKLNPGDNLIRFVPALPGDIGHFVLPILLTKLDSVEFVTAIGQDATDIANRVKRDESAVADAYWWFRKNAPEQLHSDKTNPQGFKLSPKRRGIAWVVAYDHERILHLNLFEQSLYAGDKGTKGLLGDILTKSKEEDTDPETGESTPKFGDISHPTEGNFVSIKKTVDPQAKTPAQKMKGTSYSVSISTKKSKPVQDLLNEVSDEEFNRLRKLTTIVEVSTYEEQQVALREYIGPKWFDKIFNKEEEPNTKE
jgi:hypothetical protein